MKICPDCLKTYKLSSDGARARAAAKRGEKAAWGKRNWPQKLYHPNKTRKCASHHAQALASSSQRRAKKLRATPKWADKKAILSIYAEAKRIERETGIKMHVDHIVPLQGVNVTGLHTHTNLQIIPASENIKKSNKFQGAL